MISKHNFSLRVSNVTAKPLNKAEYDQALKNIPEKVLLVNADDDLLATISNKDYNGQELLVVAKDGKPGGLLTLPTIVDHLASSYNRLLSFMESVLASDNIQKTIAVESEFDKLVGRSSKMQEIIKLCKKVAATDTPILVRGESGTGKETFARALHRESLRHDGTFITVNCGAIPPSLFESELFGFAEKAFIGANAKGKPGIIELADGGTIFLDEVGEIPVDIQVKLLGVMQEKQLTRVGSTEPIKVDVRIIAASHRNLENLLEKELFREDLYYQLNVISIEMPPLRKRKEDIPELVNIFTQEFSAVYNKHFLKVEPEVISAFMEYSWPGNIRELKNAVEHMVVLAESKVVTINYLPENLRNYTYISMSVPEKGNLMNMAVEAEKQLILKTLEKANGNRSEAARLLGIPRSTLYYKLRQLSIPTKSQS